MKTNLNNQVNENNNIQVNENNNIQVNENNNIQVNGMNNIKASNPCDKCPNNPKNNPNASGICWCALPYFANPVNYL